MIHTHGVSPRETKNMAQKTEGRKTPRLLEFVRKARMRLAAEPNSTMGSNVSPIGRTQDHDISDEEREETPGEIDPEDEKVVINVGGIRHETLVSSLIHKEGTRLCALAKKHQTVHKDEYFFDRHPGVFSTVMDYYRSGELHVPLDVCGAVVKRELDFWKIDDHMIEACCWTSYSSYIDNQKTLSDFNQSVVQETEEVLAMKNDSGWRKYQMVIWMILDYPRSSKLAMGYAITSFLFVLASIAGFCVETLPLFYNITFVNASSQCDESVSGDEQIEHRETVSFLTNLDYLCTAFFTLELLIRIFFAPNKLEFFRSVMNIIDIMALMPLYVQIILDATDRYSCLKNHRAVLETIFVLRIVRIFRIFHLVKHYRALTILVHAIKASIHELLMLSIFLFIATLVFSTLIFYAERKKTSKQIDANNFSTIPIGFWWSIITMTTVGYGDVHPSSPMGCVIGALCALCGVLLIALTIPVISNNFALFYLHARTREGFCKKKKGSSNRAISKTKSKLSASDSSDRKKGLDSRALLSNDSISTTDESAMMFNARHAETMSNSPSITPAHTHRDHHSAIRVPIADIDETIM